MTQTIFRPDRLDIRAFAQEGALLTGSVLPSKMARLAQDLYVMEQDSSSNSGGQPVSWQARGEMVPFAAGAAQPWVHLNLQTQVQLQCQRCLGPVTLPIDVARSFRFVKSEDEAAGQDDEAEEELLVIDKQFDLISLMEDELIMALPMVPTHDVCPVKVKLASSADDFEEALAEKPKAFAALGVLKAIRK